MVIIDNGIYTIQIKEKVRSDGNEVVCDLA